MLQAVMQEQARNIVRQIREAETPKAITHQPSCPMEAMTMIADNIQESINEAKKLGVSPDKLAPLYNSLIKARELTAELKGDLDRSNKTLNIVKIDIKKEVEEYAKAIELSR